MDSTEDNQRTLPRLAIVIPCYNEQAVLLQTLDKLMAYLQDLVNNNKIAADSFLYIVDDGSKDQTWNIISSQHARFPQIKGLKLTRNVGHQSAILAGIMHVKKMVDCAITMDADLQDDINAIGAMIESYKAGYDIVYGVRIARSNDTVFKRFTAKIFYKILKQSGADIIPDHADFRLLSKRTMHTLTRFKERNLFLRGIFPLIGYPTGHVYYERSNRLAGESKYTLRKMIALAWDGITSFSHIPLSFILSLGIISFIASIVMIAWVLLAKLTLHAVPGWASIMIPVCLMGGVQLLSVGIIGEYIAKIYFEVKRRPRYIKDMEL